MKLYLFSLYIFISICNNLHAAQERRITISGQKKVSRADQIPRFAKPIQFGEWLNLQSVKIYELEQQAKKESRRGNEINAHNLLNERKTIETRIKMAIKREATTKNKIRTFFNFLVNSKRG